MRVKKIGRKYIIPNDANYYPSVTEITNGSNTSFFTPQLKNGTNVHEKLDIFFKNGLWKSFFVKYRDDISVKNIDEDIANFVINVFDILLNNGLNEPNLIECESEISFFHEKLGYKGTVDLIIFAPGHPFFLIDFKTGETRSAKYKAQIGGYSILLKNEWKFQELKAFLVYEFESEKVDLSIHEPVFLNLLEKFKNNDVQEKTTEKMDETMELSILTNELFQKMTHIQGLEDEVAVLKDQVKNLLGEKNFKNEFLNIGFKSSYERESINDDGIAYIKLHYPQFIKKTQIKANHSFSLVKNK